MKNEKIIFSVCVPNVQIIFFLFSIFENWILPNFQFNSVFSNFQKLSIIKYCINFQFSLTSAKVKNWRILKITLIFNSRQWAQNSEVANGLNLQYFTVLGSSNYYRQDFILFGRILNLPVHQKVLLSLYSYYILFQAYSDIFKHYRKVCSRIFRTLCIPGIFKTLTYSYHRAYSDSKVYS